MPIGKAIKKAIEQLKEKKASQDAAEVIREQPSVGSRLASRMRAQDLSTDDRRPRQSTRFRSRSRDGRNND